MEIILAIVVAIAVILFGALISMGNERQRKAIDGLREQIVLWARQDLRIKRERLTCDVKVDDPMDWLNKIIGRASGLNMDLRLVEVYKDLDTLVCISGSSTNKVLITSKSPHEILIMKNRQKNKLARLEENPLFSLPRKFLSYEFSGLNEGILFELELEQVWKDLTGNLLGVASSMWVYLPRQLHKLI